MCKSWYILTFTEVRLGSILWIETYLYDISLQKPLHVPMIPNLMSVSCERVE